MRCIFFKYFRPVSKKEVARVFLTSRVPFDVLVLLVIGSFSYLLRANASRDINAI